jgi:hypothetical protein
MAAGVINRLWEISDIIALLPVPEAKERGPHKKRAMNEITWGDTVQISDDAPVDFRPGELGEVCGISEMPDQTIMYTVEFGDGADAIVPKTLVKKIRFRTDALH